MQSRGDAYSRNLRFHHSCGSRSCVLQLQRSLQPLMKGRLVLAHSTRSSTRGDGSGPPTEGGGLLQRQQRESGDRVHARVERMGVELRGVRNQE